LRDSGLPVLYTAGVARGAQQMSMPGSLAQQTVEMYGFAEIVTIHALLALRGGVVHNLTINEEGNVAVGIPVLR
jgi:hypothetical protein